MPKRRGSSNSSRRPAVKKQQNVAKPKEIASVTESSTKAAPNVNSHANAKPKPRPIQIRRPLQIHEQRQKLRARVRNARRKIIESKDLQDTFKEASRSFTGSDIHPIAVISWLSSEEPFHADMLRDAFVGDVTGMPGAKSVKLAAEMETLVDIFKSTNLSNDSLLANPLIDIPKGFGMQLVCYSQDYGALIAEVKKREGAMYHMGLLHKHGTLTERKYGFDPTEMLKKHALSFPPDFNLKSSDLDNDAHDIFKSDNFHGCPSHIYDQLLPGLRLATHLILHRSTAHFWHTLAFGSRKLDEALTLTHGHRCFRVGETVSYDTANASRFSEFLSSLVSTVHFHFSLWPLPSRSGLYAGMAIIPDYKRGKPHNPRSSDKESLRKCRICLHTDFYTTAARLSKLQNPDPSLVLRFNFFLAITICHEIAHFVEMNGSHESAKALQESYWGEKSSRPEIGSAFEEAVFGGKVHPIASRVDCAWGCTVYDNPDSIDRGRKSASEDFDEEKTRRGRRRASSGASLGLLCDLTKFYTVPMDYIARLQQRETWEAGTFDEDDLDAGKALLIPRDGAQAVSVPVFDMTVWDDDAGATISDEVDAGNTPFRRLDDGSIVKFEPPKEEKQKSQDVSMEGLDLDFAG